jgi:TolB-like protein
LSFQHVGSEQTCCCRFVPSIRERLPPRAKSEERSQLAKRHADCIMTGVRYSLIACALVSFAGALRAQCPDGSPPPCAARPIARPPVLGVAVLYFENASRDSAYTYLAEGLTESLIDRFGHSGIPVTSRYVVRRLRDERTAPPADLAKWLNASHAVSGSVRVAGTSLRVSVELIRLPAGERVWGRQFDRPSEDLLAVESEIATTVADSVLGRIQPSQRRKLVSAPTTSPAAYDHFQRGRFYLAQRTG